MNARIIAVGVASILSAGCLGGGSARSAWQDVISRCAKSDLNGKKILFFGPSNAVGAGSVWRIDSEGVYRLRYDLAHMPTPQDFYAPSTTLACDGTSSRKFKVALSGAFDQQAALSAEASAEISKARSVAAKATSVQWVSIAEGAYDSYVKNVAKDSDAGKDLMTGTRRVLTRAFKVSGFTAKITFDSSNAVSAKAKIPAGAVLPGGIGGGLTASWSEGGELTLTSSGDFYIAGELQEYKPTGFSGANVTGFAPAAEVPVNAKVSREN